MINHYNDDYYIDKPYNSKINSTLLENYLNREILYKKQITGTPRPNTPVLVGDINHSKKPLEISKQTKFCLTLEDPAPSSNTI